MDAPQDPAMNPWVYGISFDNIANHSCYKKNQFKYYQQFINRHLHSEIYTSFTHYFHLPRPIDLVATWHHHIFLAAHPCATCPCATHPHATHPCAAFPGCSPSSWLKMYNTKRLHTPLHITGTSTRHKSSQITLLTC